MSSSNSRRQPPVRIAPPSTPAPLPDRLTWQMRLRAWWRRLLDGPPSNPVPPAPPPAPIKVGYDVLAMPLTYHCSVCGGKLLFAMFASEVALARSRFAVGACIKSSCQMRDVRLRVPLLVIANCETVDE